VAELTGLLDLSGWPTGMRVIVRKERPHPGAQLRITDAVGMRVTAFATNTTLGQLADLDRHGMRHEKVHERDAARRTYPGCRHRCVRAMSAVHWHGRPLLSQDLVPVAIVLSDGGASRALSPSPHAMHGIRLQLRSDQDVEESCQLPR
jgi:hypothetical protein